MVSKERLRELYVKEGMTQGEIADELGYSQPYISRKMSEHDIDSSYASGQKRKKSISGRTIKAPRRRRFLKTSPTELGVP
jgi:predicted transcriptional regulator